MDRIAKIPSSMEIGITESSWENFITCSCGFRERVGIPCRHMMCVLDGAVEISMMDVHWWKAWRRVKNL